MDALASGNIASLAARRNPSHAPQPLSEAKQLRKTRGRSRPIDIAAKERVVDRMDPVVPCILVVGHDHYAGERIAQLVDHAEALLDYLGVAIHAAPDDFCWPTPTRAHRLEAFQSHTLVLRTARRKYTA